MSDLVKQAGLISAADFLRLFIKTIIGFVLARILTQSEYGTYRQLFMIYTLLSAFFMIGLPQSIYYFIPKSDDETKKRFIKQTIDIFTILGLLCSILLLVFRNSVSQMFQNPQLNKVLLIYAFYPFFMFLSQLYYCVMIGLQKPNKAAQFTIIAVTCDIVLILGTALISKDLYYIIIGMLISVLIQWIYARFGLAPMSAKNKLFDYDKSMIKAQFNYSLPIGVAAIVGVLSSQIDKLVISRYFTPDVFAIFSVGAAELPFISIITNSVNAVILPEMNKKSDTKAICELYSGAVRKNALILFPIFTFCLVFAPNIIEILYSAKYLDSVPFFRIYLISMPLRIATYGLLFQVFNKTKYIFVISLVTLLLNTIMSLIMIKLIGIKGPAISAIVVTYITVAVYLYLIINKLKIKLSNLFPTSALLRTALSSIICAIISLSALSLKVYIVWQFIIGAVIYALCYFLISILLKAILPYDLVVLKSILNSIINKFKRALNV
jgi:O-antigen/teichoic acid export membrane protein